MMQVDGICRCGNKLKQGLTPCDHCDTVCITTKCGNCKAMLKDSEGDSEYYKY